MAAPRPRASILQITVAACLHHVDRRPQPHRFGQRPHRDLAAVAVVLRGIDLAVRPLFSMAIELDQSRGAGIGRELVLREDLKQPVAPNTAFGRLVPPTEGTAYEPN